MSKPRGNTSPADMSLPPEQRRRRRKPGVIATPPAQMDHATSPRAKRLNRDGQRWLAAEAQEREGAGGAWGTIFVQADGSLPVAREWDDSRD